MTPSKNRINFHDIIAQPLGSLRDAVDAVIRRPESLDDKEVQNLFSETSYLLLRTEEALATNAVDAASALIQLLLEGLTCSEASLEVGLTTFALQDDLLQSLKSIFTLVFSDGALSIFSTGAADLAQVICTLSDGEALKDACGEHFMLVMAHLLQRLYDRPLTSNMHFQTQRSIAAALINLLKGSVKNKQRLEDWSFLLPCFTMSVDVFFQLQCVEMLYRVSRRNKDFLKNLAEQQQNISQNEKLASMLTALDALPNDQSLLGRMLELVERANGGRADVLLFHVRQVLAAETSITDSTKVYFSPHYFVVLIASSSADNMTIPYTSIRSVTIGKEGRVMFRLEEFPTSLDPVLSHSASGMDTVTLQLSMDQLAKLKSSPIRSWIVKILEEKKQGKAPQEAVPPVPVPTEEAGASLPIPLLATVVEDHAPPSGPELQLLSVSDHHEHPDGGAADDSLRQVLSEGLRQMPLPERGGFLSQLEQLAVAKAEIRRVEDIASLNAMVGGIQALVDATRERCKRSREEWLAEVSGAIDEADNDIERIEQTAAAAVGKLNDGLHDIKKRNTAVEERVAGLRLGLEQIVAESRATEQEFMETFRLECDAELERHESLRDEHPVSTFPAGAMHAEPQHYSLPSLLT